jgi:hypothetical protein
MADEPSLEYESPEPLSASKAVYLYAAAAAISLVGHGICFRAIWALWSIPAGTIGRPMGAAAMMLMGVLVVLVFGGPVALAGFMMGDRRPSTKRVGLIALLLILTPGIWGTIAWKSIVWAHRLTMAV